MIVLTCSSLTSQSIPSAVGCAGDVAGGGVMVAGLRLLAQVAQDAAGELTSDGAGGSAGGTLGNLTSGSGRTLAALGA